SNKGAVPQGNHSPRLGQAAQGQSTTNSAKANSTPKTTHAANAKPIAATPTPTPKPTTGNVGTSHRPAIGTTPPLTHTRSTPAPPPAAGRAPTPPAAFRR